MHENYTPPFADVNASSERSDYARYESKRESNQTFTDDHGNILSKLNGRDY